MIGVRIHSEQRMFRTLFLVNISLDTEMALNLNARYLTPSKALGDCLQVAGPSIYKRLHKIMLPKRLSIIIIITITEYAWPE